MSNYGKYQIVKFLSIPGISKVKAIHVVNENIVFVMLHNGHCPSAELR